MYPGSNLVTTGSPIGWIVFAGTTLIAAGAALYRLARRTR